MMNDFSILSSEIVAFLVVYEQQSINAAARKLAQDQGNISRTIAKLERSVGEKLFIRHKNGLTASELGHRFYAAISVSKHSFSEKIRKNGEQKRMSIGFSSAIGYAHFSSSMIHLIIEKNFYPEFIIDSSMRIIDLLKKRELDFALVNNTIKFPGIIARPLASEGLTLSALSNQHQKTLLLHPDMLSAEKILLSIQHEQRWLIKDYFMIAKMLENNSTLMGILPESFLSSHPKLKVIQKFTEEGKITALSWPGSVGLSLMEIIKR